MEWKRTSNRLRRLDNINDMDTPFRGKIAPKYVTETTGAGETEETLFFCLVRVASMSENERCGVVKIVALMGVDEIWIQLG